MIRYGVYSKTAAAEQGTLIYGCPKGSEIEVTAVVGDPTARTWPDAELRGEVVKFLRFGRPGRLTPDAHGKDAGPGSRFPNLARLLQRNPNVSCGVKLLLDNAGEQDAPAAPPRPGP